MMAQMSQGQPWQIRILEQSRQLQVVVI